jgi:hypothetical protein
MLPDTTQKLALGKRKALPAGHAILLSRRTILKSRWLPIAQPSSVVNAIMKPISNGKYLLTEKRDWIVMDATTHMQPV